MGQIPSKYFFKLYPQKIFAVSFKSYIQLVLIISFTSFLQPAWIKTDSIVKSSSTVGCVQLVPTLYKKWNWTEWVALRALSSNITCSHVCRYACMCVCSLYLRCAFVFMFLSLFWIQIWYHFYLQSIWLIYQHIHIPKTMSASNLTKFATELLFFIPRNICCFAISTPSDSIGSKSYYFFTTL